MIALEIMTEQEFKAVEKDMDVDKRDIKIPGLYYEHMDTWYVRDVYDANMLKDFGYIIARPACVVNNPKA